MFVGNSKINSNVPCLNCAERHLKCHATCDKYAAFRAGVDQTNAARREYIDHCSFRKEERIHLRKYISRTKNVRI